MTVSSSRAPQAIPFDFLVAAGLIAGYKAENKFGQSTNVDQTATDIWDRANATDDQAIWVAPTQARVHNIVSSDDGDVGGGAGARTLRVYGLTDWDTVEQVEDITLNGTTNVPTVNAYVIIHRLEVLTKGATSSNIGLITATAVTDGTVTAQINVGEGQTQMAIYGLPSVQIAYMTQFWTGLNKSGGSPAGVDMRVLLNPEPNVQLTNFITKHRDGLLNAGSSHFVHPFKPYKQFPGPCIIKMQGLGGANDLDISAGFDLVIKDN